MIHYPAYKVAAAHIAPVFLDTGGSVGQERGEFGTHDSARWPVAHATQTDDT
jgi:hypothetical protein